MLSNLRNPNLRFLWCNQSRNINFWFKKSVEKRGNYNIVKPGIVSAMREVPAGIPCPSYYMNGVPKEGAYRPEIKTGEEIKGMRDSCKLSANVLAAVGRFLKPGVTTDEVDGFAHEFIITAGAYPSPLYYRNFPKSICTSVNNVACHGIPDDRPLEDGDIINVDVTVFYKGYHGDCSKTFCIGDVDPDGIELVRATEHCLNEAISICRPEQEFNKIGALIEQTARRLRLTVVPAFIGHGIGHYFHGPPDIYHTANSYPGVMKSGMTFTIEPILTYGAEDIEVLEDEWTAVTMDGARTAQFEHTILITEEGAEILTASDD